MATDPVLDALKARTRQLHDNLEARVDVLSRLQSLESYQQLLTAFFGFYAPLEAHLSDCVALKSAGLDFEPRRKVPLLVADLEFFRVDANSLPRAVDLPQIGSASDGFGCLYVLEGATLGSQIIKRLLVQHLKISADNGGAFFNAYGDRVGQMWDTFRRLLSQYAAAHATARDEIVVAAEETFLRLDAWFARCLC